MTASAVLAGMSASYTRTRAELSHHGVTVMTVVGAAGAMLAFAAASTAALSRDTATAPRRALLSRALVASPNVWLSCCCQFHPSRRVVVVVVSGGGGENHVCFGRIHSSQLREGANAGQHTPTPTLSLPPSHHCFNGEVYRGNRHYNVCVHTFVHVRTMWYGTVYAVHTRVGARVGTSYEISFITTF
jgi:hypothetical protein